MQLYQCLDAEGGKQVIAVADGEATGRVLDGVGGVYGLALKALDRNIGLQAMVNEWPGSRQVDIEELANGDELLTPIDHPDPAHLLITGTGLTHLGSAEGRDKMHRQLEDTDSLTDSMRMFRLGLDGGKPAGGAPGVQPEWFYKGDGSIVVAPGEALESPDFALDGGEEPEIAGVYIIDNQGQPRRLGFVLGNEFSDHVTERQNYLYLAHSKLRACSFGPALRLGDLPDDIRGISRIRRDGQVLWEKPFLSGEANMCHSIANLEAHHFKYAQFRRPGDIHVHFLGTATLSCADEITTRVGDIFEIEAEIFGPVLRNPLEKADQALVSVTDL
ncbi:GguC family protein [Marinobacter nanhaiticus D15-8W]|uniref:FAH family protein n=1 Tax=Marinobacter nanhaiticus D15-8W TaxID=626887 RepID=N6WQV1_9GAMM|nr:AraD1 family protein [Marinobacter nanhaiticus]ENO13966.1 FAH family protein [Marinobacter nanhaiticus D15-8W]BES71344.1 GguC family protein [Marinobacter nanhaiticus D15-8W]